MSLITHLTMGYSTFADFGATASTIERTECLHFPHLRNGKATNCSTYDRLNKAFSHSSHFKTAILPHLNWLRRTSPSHHMRENHAKKG